MTQCERLPDWCDAAAWRGDKPRVCHEATLPKISTGNFLSNMSATVGSDTCNVLWWGECAQSERIPDWCDSAWHRDKPTGGGVSLTPGNLVNIFNLQIVKMAWTLFGPLWLVSGPCPKAKDITQLPKSPNKNWVTHRHLTNKDFMSYFLLTVGPKSQTNPVLHHTPPNHYPVCQCTHHYLPTTPVQSFPPVGTRPKDPGGTVRFEF